jgi:hypothetical protein
MEKKNETGQKRKEMNSNQAVFGFLCVFYKREAQKREDTIRSF